MSESAQIIDVLKRMLKTRGITYRDLSRRVNLSEASIKRIFAEETFTLHRLEKVCAAIGMTVGELIRSAATEDTQSNYLKLEQEQILAQDPRLLACFYLLLNGRSTPDIQTRLSLNEREVRSLYVKLDDARLIELLPGLKARLRVGPIVTWRSDGPVRRVYERQVKAEFLHSDFTGADESLQFCTAELSDASVQLLFRKLEQLSREFADYAALDRHLPLKQKRSVALLLAFRPWVFSMFDGIQRAKKQ
ncbi:MAG: helix-turn-helix transcriptional regulator [Steroidobacter sp.]